MSTRVVNTGEQVITDPVRSTTRRSSTDLTLTECKDHCQTLRCRKVQRSRRLASQYDGIVFRGSRGLRTCEPDSMDRETWQSSCKQGLTVPCPREAYCDGSRYGASNRDEAWESTRRAKRRPRGRIQRLETSRTMPWNLGNPDPAVTGWAACTTHRVCNPSQRCGLNLSPTSPQGLSPPDPGDLIAPDSPRILRADKMVSNDEAVCELGQVTRVPQQPTPTPVGKQTS